MSTGWKVREPEGFTAYVEDPRLCHACNDRASYDRGFTGKNCTGREFYVPKKKVFYCEGRKSFLVEVSLLPGLQFIRPDTLEESDFVKITPEELTPEVLALFEVMKS